MTTLNDFFKTDLVDDHIAADVNDLISAALRSEYKNVETLSGTRTLLDADTPIQRFECGAADRTVKMPTADSVENHPYFIVNASAGARTITVQNNGGTVTIGTIAQGASKLLLPDGNGGYLSADSALTDNSVALAKLVNATAQYKMMARTSAGSGAWQELTSSANMFSLLGAANYAAARALLGAAGVTLISTVPHKQLWIGNARPTLTGGCAGAVQIEMGTNKNVYDYLAFDKDTIEYAYANIAMPQDYTGGTIYATFWWTHPSTTTNFKVSWGLQAVSFSDDDTLDAAQGTAQYANDTGGTTSDLYVSPQTAAITIAGTPVAGDLVNFRILRKADDGTNDTLAVDAYLLGVMVWYPVNA
jgi:hypothetical protein